MNYTLYIKITVLFLLSALLSPLNLSPMLAQTAVNGHVVNEQGVGIEYVSIGIEEDSVGVISDAQGYFSLTVPKGRRDKLSFTHVSYQTATIPYQTYANGEELTVTLQDKVVELAEVVVGKKNKPHTLSGKSWVSTGTVGFAGAHKGEDIEWGPIFQNSKDCLHQLTRDIEGALIDLADWAENVGYQESPEKFATLFADVATTTIAASGAEPECGGVRYPGVLMAEVMEDATEGILCGVVGENRKLLWGWKQ